MEIKSVLLYHITWNYLSYDLENTSNLFYINPLHRNWNIQPTLNFFITAYYSKNNDLQYLLL